MTTPPTAPAPSVIGISRWRRPGGEHDRAYVRVDGVEVGYRDLVTGEIVCLLDGHTATIDCTTAELFVAAPRHRRASG